MNQLQVVFKTAAARMANDDGSAGRFGCCNALSIVCIEFGDEDKLYHPAMALLKKYFMPQPNEYRGDCDYWWAPDDHDFGDKEWFDACRGERVTALLLLAEIAADEEAA